MNNPHMNKELLNRFHDNNLSDNEIISLLDHISKCTYCADAFAASFHDENLFKAPKNLKEQVLINAQSIRVFPRRQLFFYSLRVCAAMCGALFILFSTMTMDSSISRQFTIPKRPAAEYQAKTFSFMEDLNESMNQFTYRINEKMNNFVKNTTNKTNKTEVNNNGKTQK